MIEMLGVLAVVGILSAGGIMGYSKAMENHKTNVFIDEINKVVAGSIEFVHSATSGFVVSRLCQNGILKVDNFCRERTPFEAYIGAIVEIGYGGLFVLKQTSGEELNCRIQRDIYFDIRYQSKLPLGACVKLLTYNWGYYGFRNYVKFLNPDVRVELPLSTATAEENCQKYRTSTNFLLVFGIEGKCEEE